MSPRKTSSSVYQPPLARASAENTEATIPTSSWSWEAVYRATLAALGARDEDEVQAAPRPLTTRERKAWARVAAALDDLRKARER